MKKRTSISSLLQLHTFLLNWARIHYPVRKVSLFLSNWNAFLSHPKCFQLNSFLTVYMWLPLLGRSILNYKIEIITFSIFSDSEHNFKSKFQIALIKFTNPHLVKFLKTLNLMDFHQNKLKYNEVQLIFVFIMFLTAASWIPSGTASMVRCRCRMLGIRCLI
jgi:hypothetical protein